LITLTLLVSLDQRWLVDGFGDSFRRCCSMTGEQISGNATESFLTAQPSQCCNA
jgi:hypothetical protein